MDGGYYCPSPVMDLITTNIERNPLYKRIPKDLKNKMEYAFDAKGRLILQKMYLHDERVFYFEYLFYSDTKVFRLQYERGDCGYWPDYFSVQNYLQDRIVSELSKWMGIIDVIEQGKIDLQTVIKEAKSKILDLAIHGKLVPQDPNDEPASELLKRINPNAEITCDNGQYGKMPNKWCLTKGSSIFRQMKSTKPYGKTFIYVDIDSIDNKTNAISSIKELQTINAPSRASRYTERGDIVFSMVRPYLRNIAQIAESNCIASTGFYICSPYECMHQRFCYYLMLSNYVVDGLNMFMRGDNSPSITKGNIDNWLFPLPPLPEQQRIVDAIDKAFAKLDAIMESL
jgi:type I restriction enzyme S subunit